MRSDWTESENEARFERCYRSPGHGQNTGVEVTVSGKSKPETGMIAR